MHQIIAVYVPQYRWIRFKAGKDWKPEGRKNRGRPPENLETWNIYSHE